MSKRELHVCPTCKEKYRGDLHQCKTLFLCLVDNSAKAAAEKCCERPFDRLIPLAEGQHRILMRTREQREEEAERCVVSIGVVPTLSTQLVKKKEAE